MQSLFRTLMQTSKNIWSSGPSCLKEPNFKTAYPLCGWLAVSQDTTQHNLKRPNKTRLTVQSLFRTLMQTSKNIWSSGDSCLKEPNFKTVRTPSLWTVRIRFRCLGWSRDHQWAVDDKKKEKKSKKKKIRSYITLLRYLNNLGASTYRHREPEGR